MVKVSRPCHMAVGYSIRWGVSTNPLCCNFARFLEKYGKISLILTISPSTTHDHIQYGHHFTVPPFSSPNFRFAEVTNNSILWRWMRIARKMSPLESGVILIGLPLDMNGPIDCAGHAIWWVGREIIRISRPPLACEADSLSMVSDSSIWRRSVLMEFWFCISITPHTPKPAKPR